MITLNAKQIREVTSEGIRYVDDQAGEQFIDFAECYQNYVKKRTSHEYWEEYKKWNNLTDADWDRHVERIKNWREVGTRNILGDYKTVDGQTFIGLPYFQFYTDPRIRFEFEDKNEWSELQDTIIKARWRTFDLT